MFDSYYINYTHAFSTVKLQQALMECKNKQMYPPNHFSCILQVRRQVLRCKALTYNYNDHCSKLHK